MIYLLKKITKSKKGETIIETLIALSVLAIGITMASTAILNSLRNMTNAKSRVIAINIAREGIEAMRNIRDTNWLRYSNQRRLCWNHMPDGTPCTDGDNPILPGTYIVYKHTDNSWRLEWADDDTGISDGTPADSDNYNDNINLAPLSLVDIDLLYDSDGADTDNDPATPQEADDTDMYNHEHADVAADSLGDEVRTTNFKRIVVVEYLKDQPDDSLPSNLSPPDDSISNIEEWNNGAIDNSTLNRMRITSIVTWFRGSRDHSVELKTHLSDHLARTNLSN